MCELKKIGKVFTSKFVGTGPSSYKKRIYRAAVSQRLRNTDVVYYMLDAHLLLQPQFLGYKASAVCSTSYISSLLILPNSG
jgi:hypothetical protein